MANQLVFTQDEINTLSPSGNDISKVMHAVSVLASDNATPEDITEAKAVMVSHRDEVADIWQKYKLLEKLLKTFKDAMELSIGKFTDEEGNIAGFEKQFKWQKGATTKTVVGMGTLIAIAQANGMNPEEIGAYLKPMAVKDAAKMLGMSDEAFCNNYGSLVEVKKNKDTLKGI